MPIVRPQFANGEFYHIVARGVESRVIFSDISDYYRAIFSLYEFNDEKRVLIKDRRKFRNLNKVPGGLTADEKDLIQRVSGGAKPRKLLVKILAFCLMPNHLHLLLEQIKDDGISLFMRKFGAGYAGYFNRKYDRVGHLFQGRFRAVYVGNDEQLKNLFVYIHTNPAALVAPGWKEGKVENTEEVIKFLETYKWSSYQDYIGKQNFPSLTDREFLGNLFGSQSACKDFVNGWVKYKEGGDIEYLEGLTLE